MRRWTTFARKPAHHSKSRLKNNSRRVLARADEHEHGRDHETTNHHGESTFERTGLLTDVADDFRNEKYADDGGAIDEPDGSVGCRAGKKRRWQRPERRQVSDSAESNQRKHR